MRSMDRRQSPRLPGHESVTLTRLSSDPRSVPSAPLAAQIVERSASGLRIETSEHIAPATLVRLDLADSLLLGEVAWCAKVSGRYHVGLQMEQSLQHLGDLRRLVASLLGYDERRSLNQSEAVEARHD
jgi:PilZ domain